MRTTVLTVFAIFVISLFNACTESPPDEPENILRMSAGPSPDSIDPHTVAGSVGITILWALTEGLVRVDYGDMSIHPAAAERWRISENGLEYRFFLRPDLRWSNGEPLTARDFVYSWHRIFTPGLGNQFAPDYYAIKNAKSLHLGELKSPHELGVRAEGPNELVFELHRPDPLFMKRLATPMTAPVQKSTIERYGRVDDPNNTWVNAGNFVGNGPFRLAEWEINKTLKVTKNPYYWGAENVHLDGIHFYPVDSEVVAERMFRSGQIDLVFDRRIPTEKIAGYKAQSPSPLVSQTDYASYFYLFNTTRPPFDDENVRRAFTAAVDRTAIVEHVTQNGERIALALSPVAAGYTPPRGQGFDPQAAKTFLAKAGYKSGADFPETTLVYNTADIHRKVAVAIQQMWKKHLGVTVNLENQEWKVFLDTRQQHNYDIARAGSVSALGDPEDFLNTFTSTHPMNDSGWQSSGFDTLIEKSKGSLDSRQRFRYLFEAEQLLVEALPLLPLYYYSSNYLISPGVEGFEFNMLGMPYFQGVTINREAALENAVD